MGEGDERPGWVTAGWAEAYQRILGEELRMLRDLRGWSRRQLREELGLEVALPTLTAYELGTRQVGSVRLAQICLALGEDLGRLLARVHDRLGVDTADVKAAGWVVDLVAAAEVDDSRLLPLRGWARARLADGQPGTVRLRPSGLYALAVLCGMDAAELERRLAAPDNTPAWRGDRREPADPVRPGVAAPTSNRIPLGCSEC